MRSGPNPKGAGPLFQTSPLPLLRLHPLVAPVDLAPCRAARPVGAWIEEKPPWLADAAAAPTATSPVATTRCRELSGSYRRVTANDETATSAETRSRRRSRLTCRRRRRRPQRPDGGKDRGRGLGERDRAAPGACVPGHRDPSRHRVAHHLAGHPGAAAGRTDRRHARPVPQGGSRTRLLLRSARPGSSSPRSSTSPYATARCRGTPSALPHRSAAPWTTTRWAARSGLRGHAGYLGASGRSARDPALRRRSGRRATADGHDHRDDHLRPR